MSSHSVTVSSEPGRNKQRLPLICPRCRQTYSHHRTETAFWRHGFSVWRCRWTGRRRITFAASCWVNDFRNSRRSQRTEKAAPWEMNVTGKQKPEQIERPTSLSVPSSASTPFGIHVNLTEHSPQIGSLHPREMCSVGAVKNGTQAVLVFDVQRGLQTTFQKPSVYYSLPYQYLWILTRHYTSHLSQIICSKCIFRHIFSEVWRSHLNKPTTFMKSVLSFASSPPDECNVTAQGGSDACARCYKFRLNVDTIKCNTAVCHFIMPRRTGVHAGFLNLLCHAVQDVKLDR